MQRDGKTVTQGHYIARQKSAKFVVGIDEVGRGPLAGPVSIGIAVVRSDFEFTAHLPSFTDSKKMTERAREKVVHAAEVLRDAGQISFGVYSCPAEIIDESGIEFAIQKCINDALSERVSSATDAMIFLDGRLKAPSHYSQEAIIKGDGLIPVISLASVIAKVTRDKYMVNNVHSKYPEYGFDSHKGYGTSSHIAAIKKFGLSPVHRKSFLSRILPETV